MQASVIESLLPPFSRPNSPGNPLPHELPISCNLESNNSNSSSVEEGEEEGEEELVVIKRTRQRLVFSASTTLAFLLGVLLSLCVVLVVSQQDQSIVQTLANLPHRIMASSSSSSVSSSRDIVRVPNGHIILENVPTYSVGKADDVLLLLPDVFGSKESTWAVSDRLAASGEFTVLDMQYSLDPWNGQGPVTTWKFNHPFEPIIARLTQVILHLQSRGYTSIQVQGMCYGGRLSLILAQTPLVRSSVAAHPSDLTDYDPVAVIQPASLIVPQFDDKSFLDQVPYWNTTLSNRKMDYKIKVYPGATHGFFTTTDAANTTNGIQQGLAITDALAWFRAHK